MITDKDKNDALDAYKKSVSMKQSEKYWIKFNDAISLEQDKNEKLFKSLNHTKETRNRPFDI